MPKLADWLKDHDEVAIEDAYFNGDCRHFFQVDWREDDADIVDYCASCIASKTLHAEWQDDDSLVIIQDGTENTVPHNMDEGRSGISPSGL